MGSSTQCGYSYIRTSKSSQGVCARGRRGGARAATLRVCQCCSCCINVCMLCVQSLQSCPMLCEPMDCSRPQTPLSMQILQAGILEWIAMPSSKASSQPRHRTLVSCTAGRLFTIEPPRKPHIRVCSCTGRVCTRWAWES